MSSNIAKQISELGKLYDNNEYQRGLKTVIKFMKKFPNNFELIAWKGLFLQFTKDKKGATENITAAIRGDIKNPHIWKINGIILKEQCEYTKSLQAFTQAYKMDPSDEPVLYDLCNLLLYERNFATLNQYTKTLLKNPTLHNIMRHALASHLNGKTESALKFLNIYEENLFPAKNNDEELFRSELYIFHSRIMLEIGKYDECLEYLEKVKDKVIDKVAVLEKIVECCLKLDKKEKALENVRELLKYYNENGDYFNICEKLLTPEEYMKMLFEYKEKTRSRYAEVRILELMDINDSRFVELLKAYLVPYLVKGAPQIYITLAELSDEKLQIAVKIAEEANVPISSVPVVHLFKANVLARNGKYAEAIEEVNKGLKHTPTAVELISARLRFYRKSGMISKSVETGALLVEADPADRNSNVLYTNTLLRSGKVNTSYKVATPFSIDCKQRIKIFNTENNDYQVRIADAAYRAGDYKIANKFYSDVINNFDEYQKAQFNYFSWGMKHINALYDVIKFVDRLNSHKMLARASLGLMKVHFIQKNLKEIMQIATRMLNATDPAILSYTAAYFAVQNDPLPAIKAFLKIKGSWKFAAIPALNQMISNISKLPELIQEVAKESYQIINEEPKTFSEIVSYARGNALIGNFDDAKKLLTKAITSFEYTYKEALDVYTIGMNEMSDSSFADELHTSITGKYPSYELKFDYEPIDESFLSKKSNK